MTQDNIQDLERDIEATRARLDLTIDQLQGRLSVSGIVDDMLGTMRARGYDSALDHTLAVLRRNPVPVMLVAAGIGWLLYRMGRESDRRRAAGVAYAYDEADVPVLNETGARVYDPQAEALHPLPDAFDTPQAPAARTAAGARA
jgi:Protein of unknown function (DUF3618)